MAIRNPLLGALACLFVVASACSWASGNNGGSKQVIIGPTLGVYGGWGPDPLHAPYLFSWLSKIHFAGGNWHGGRNIKVHMRGPMNHPTIPPTDKVILTLSTDSTGSIFASVENSSPFYVVPYDGGVAGVLGQGLPDIPVPGHYQVVGYLDDPIIAESAAVSGGIEILPETIPGLGVDWGRSRGQRFGFLGDHSPEYLDPEWTTVWSRSPVAMYGTVAETNDESNNQPMLMAHHETPGSHYAHDGNLMVLPDPEYRWVLGTANTQGEADDKETGRIEMEWEMQNDYSPNAYQRGVVGMPLWVHGFKGDRLFTVGNWVMDGGHRGEGFRTEIHPPRLLAMMRKQQTVTPLDSPGCLVPALQVDVYAGGHGGGINQAMYPGLEDVLDNHGRGGGRMEDFIEYGGNVYDVYNRYGPGDGTLVSIIEAVFGLSTDADVHAIAGPSACGTDTNTGLPATWDHKDPVPPNIQPWVLGAEETPINDMDYDFDVILPTPPPGATTPRVTVETHGEHTTLVTEVITFTDLDGDTGLPTRAHVHLPYKGADSGIYARTYKFYWNVYSWPGRKYTVKINDILFFDPEGISFPWNDFSGKQVMWAAVNGQWQSLTDAAPDQMLSGGLQKHVTFGDAKPTFSTYLKGSQNLTLYTYGYERCSLEDHFVYDIGLSAYDAAAHIADALVNGNGDNKKRGAAFFERPQNPIVLGGILGDHYENAGYTSSGFENYTSGYSVGFTVTVEPNPHADISPAAIDFGDVVLGDTASQTLHVRNLAENFGGGGFILDVLTCALTLTGGGYTLDPALTQVSMSGAEHQDVTIKFHPTLPGQGSGSIKLDTNDACSPSVTVPFTAHVLYPEMGIIPPGQIAPTVVGCTTTKVVTVKNTGTSDLLFSPAISGADYSIEPYSADSNGKIKVTAGSSTTLTVDFHPAAVTRASRGTLTLTSNDPINPVQTVSFCAEGVQAGIRLVVIKPDGTYYSKVDQITLTNNGNPPLAINNKNMALVTIAPPVSCDTIQFHFERALLPTNSKSNGTKYTIKAKVGNSSKSLDFTLGACEFKNIFIVLP